MTSLPSGLASISARLDDSPQVRGAVAFGRMVREAEDSGMGWQPIETAPTDGTPILAYERSELDNQTPMHWFDVVQYRCPDRAPDGWYSAGDHRGPPSCSPTHWMPLPSPPDTLTSAIDRHAALAIGAGYRSADRR